METVIQEEIGCCNLCQSDDAEVVFEPGGAQEGRIVRCRNCDLMYVNPRKHVEQNSFAGLRAIGAVGKAFRMHWLEEVRQWMAKGRANSWCAVPLNMRDILRFHAIARKQP